VAGGSNGVAGGKAKATFASLRKDGSWNKTSVTRDDGSEEEIFEFHGQLPSEMAMKRATKTFANILNDEYPAYKFTALKREHSVSLSITRLETNCAHHLRGE
jgi:hypothetical protein